MANIHATILTLINVKVLLDIQYSRYDTCLAYSQPRRWPWHPYGALNTEQGVNLEHSWVWFPNKQIEQKTTKCICGWFGWLGQHIPGERN